MAKRIQINVWGRGVNALSIPSYAVKRNDETAADAVARSIARATRLEWCSGPRPDGVSMPDGARHFVGTLGCPCKGGGWSPVAEVWFSV